MQLLFLKSLKAKEVILLTPLGQLNGHLVRVEKTGSLTDNLF